MPYFLDGRGTARFRGGACVDGSLGEMLGGLGLGGRLPQLREAYGCRVSHQDDPRMRARFSGPSDFLRLASPSADSYAPAPP